MEARILVVEDDPAMRDLLVKVFRREGFASISSGSSSAIPVLGEGRFDVLLLSRFRMSPSDAASFASRARAAAPGTKILLITSHRGWGEEERAGAAEADAHVSQPFSLSDVLAAVRGLLGDASKAGSGEPARGRDQP